MITFSYIVDLTIFFVLLAVFDADWFVAFIVSWLAGALVRAIFVPPTTQATES